MRRAARLIAVMAMLFAASSLGPTRTLGAPGSQAASLQLQPYLSELSQPLLVTHAGDGSNRLFVVEKGGKIKVVVGGQLQATPFLDITSVVVSSGFEQGLLGLAFHPQFETNGRFFVYYTDRASGGSATSCDDDTNWGDNRVARYLASPASSNVANSSSGQVLISLSPDCFPNHNGGMVAFGRDGYLYVGTGDGGSGGDPKNNAQNRGSLFGKLLRLDVDHQAGGKNYATPSDNPYADATDGSLEELWAYGLRNPWRWSFDRQTGDLWIGDVGQGAWEEVDRQPSNSSGGENYGWKVMEGKHCYPSGDSCNKNGLVQPVAEYDHSLGCSITGGHVYRGSAMASLRGAYIYGDYCTGRIWSLTQGAGGSWVQTELLDTDYGISSFGEDEAGELYLTDLNGGVVYRLGDGSIPVPATATPTTQPAAATPTATPSLGATATPTATSSPARPDLKITAFSATPSTADQAIPISVTVVNQGTTSTLAGATWDVHVFADLPGPPTPAETRLVGHLELPPLAPGASTSASGQIYANTLSAGSHTLWALADGHDTVAESDESNNTTSIAVSVAAPAPTATPTPTVATDPCGPRPAVTMATVPDGPGRLRVTIGATSSSLLPNNRLRTLRFGDATNALVDAGGQTGRPGGFTLDLQPPVDQATFAVRRVQAGLAMTVSLVVVDACGDWPTFVGAGPGGP